MVRTARTRTQRLALLMFAAVIGGCSVDVPTIPESGDVPRTPFEHAVAAQGVGFDGAIGPLRPPGASLCTKITACLTTISSRTFDCLFPTQCDPDWNFVGALGLAVDVAAPLSPPSVGQIVYPVGFQGGSAPATVYRSTGNAKVLYVTTWIQLSPNFQAHSTGINKLFHMYISGLNRIFFMALGQELAPAFGLQQLAAPYDNRAGVVATSVNLRPNIRPTAVLTRGQWHRVDMILVANTPGEANGEVLLFIDGTKVLMYTGIPFAAAGTNAAWEQFTWSPTWGGAGDSVVAEMYVRADHIFISGRN